MSVFNENEKDLKECVESILNQTYRDFEFIIVNDNPQNSELEKVILSYMNIDDRIIYLKNTKNMGLALSLNKAAKVAKGEYLFRMDADDIAYPSRMKEELLLIENNSLDLVCSGYDIIDENSNIVNKNIGFYKDKSLRTCIPYQVTIHHPTVLMRKKAFDFVGGYRNFICAQDYDLWLRMWDKKLKMQIINKPLLKYRVRANSTTSKKKYAQKCTIDYIKRLFWQRIKEGKDNYSYDDYTNWLDMQGAFDEKKITKFMNDHKILSKANENRKKGNTMYSLMMRAYIFIRSDSYRKSYLGRYKTMYYIKKYT